MIGNDYTDKPRDINSHIPREQAQEQTISEQSM